MSDLINNPTTDGDLTVANEIEFDAEKVQGMLFEKRIKGASRKKKIIWMVIILLILAASGYAYTKWSGTSKSAGGYTTATIARATVSDTVEATGTLSAIKQSAMGFKNDNTITAINVQTGDTVKAGQILAKQDTTSLQASLQQTKSTVEQDQISVQSAMLIDVVNQKTLARQQKLFDVGALAQNDLDTAKDACTKSGWDVATAKSRLTIDQTKVNQAQSDISDCTLVAPFAGIIGAVNGQVGQINGINSSSSTLLTVLSTDLEMTALVNEADIGRVKVGQNIEFSSSAYSNKTFTGKVLRITPQAEAVSNVQYYPVLISVVDPDKQLLSGMSVTANIIVSQKKDVLTVPMMAVSFAQSYIKSNPTTVTNNTTKAGAGNTTNARKTRRSTQMTGISGQVGSTTTSSVANNTQTNNVATSVETTQSAYVALLKNGIITVTKVTLGLSDGSNYEVVKGLSEGDLVVVGSTQLDSQSSSSGSTSSSTSSSSSKTSSSSSRRSQGGGFGGPGGL
jgi:HlyD family secretion protein